MKSYLYLSFIRTRPIQEERASARLVCLRDLLELGLCLLLITWILIRVPLHRQPAVCLLKVIVGGIPIHFQYVVIINSHVDPNIRGANAQISVTRAPTTETTCRLQFIEQPCLGFGKETTSRISELMCWIPSLRRHNSSSVQAIETQSPFAEREIRMDLLRIRVINGSCKMEI